MRVRLKPGVDPYNSFIGIVTKRTQHFSEVKWPHCAEPVREYNYVLEPAPEIQSKAVVALTYCQNKGVGLFYSYKRDEVSAVWFETIHDALHAYFRLTQNHKILAAVLNTEAFPDVELLNVKVLSRSFFSKEVCTDDLVRELWNLFS